MDDQGVNQLPKGRFYGVGVGPGNPELLTLQAAKVIGQCPVLAVPQTKEGSTLALDIAAQAVDLAGKEILRLPFLMTRDQALLGASHRENSREIIRHLAAGRDVAMLNLGDVAIYSTYSYMQGPVEEAGYETVMIPGVPSFCAVAAVLNTGLTKMELPVQIIPAGYAGWQEYLDQPGTKILMKSGANLAEICGVLRAKGLLEKTSLVQNCGLPGQRIYAPPRDEGIPAQYFTTMVIKE